MKGGYVPEVVCYDSSVHHHRGSSTEAQSSSSIASSSYYTLIPIPLVKKVHRDPPPTSLHTPSKPAAMLNPRFPPIPSHAHPILVHAHFLPFLPPVLFLFAGLFLAAALAGAGAGACREDKHHHHQPEQNENKRSFHGARARKNEEAGTRGCMH